MKQKKTRSSRKNKNNVYNSCLQPYNLFSLYFMLLRFCFILGKELMFSQPIGHFFIPNIKLAFQTLVFGLIIYFLCILCYYDFASFWEKNSCFPSHLAIFWPYNLFSLYLCYYDFASFWEKNSCFPSHFAIFYPKY